MAQLLAPYHNGMRLGQGFNSYTQQICLDNAVLLDTDENRDVVRNYYISDDYNGLTGHDFLRDSRKKHHEESPLSTEVEAKSADDSKPARLQPWAKPQIVTYSSRFVDTLRDVTESMNISGALSIQVGTIGGKGSGSFVDSDKFKESNINFHLQVKVVNQIQKFDNYSLFNKIHNMPKEDFTTVYGDCFISGWEEGGTFDAIVSMKVTDKSKIYNIKADLEAKIGKAGFELEAKAKGEIDKQSTDKSTETTIAVNWSGGGSIKDPDEPWTIETMTKAAAAFPDLVAMCPQRTFAILTKYTALESFNRQSEQLSVLDYENANIYTNLLMEHFMEYKMMMKQISNAVYEMNRGNARAEWGEITERLHKMARVKPLPEVQVNQRLERTIVDTPPKVLKKPIQPETHGEAKQVQGSEAPQEGGSKPEEPEDLKVKQLKQIQAQTEAIEARAEASRTQAEASARQAATSALAAAASANILKDRELAVTKGETPPPLDAKLEKYRTSINMHEAAGAELIMVGREPKEPRLQFKSFYPDFDGLVAARKICRYEMAKIVSETDLITKYPKLALDTSRDDYFLEPVIFRQLLPIVRTWYDDMLPDPSQADAPIILGYVPRQDASKLLPNVCLLTPKPEDIHTALKDSIDKVQKKSKNYRMLGLAGEDQSAQPADANFFNQLENLDPTYRPLMVAIWVSESRVIQGIQLTYANGVTKEVGRCPLHLPCFLLKLAEDGSETIFELQYDISTIVIKGGLMSFVSAVVIQERAISAIRLATSQFKTLDTSKDTPVDHPNKPSKPQESSGDADEVVPQDRKVTMSIVENTTESSTRRRPDWGLWSLRGFFGFVSGDADLTRVSTLGDVWGKDKFVPRPQSTEILSMSGSYYNAGSNGRVQIAKIYGDRKSYCGSFILGELARTGKEKDVVYFNQLRDMKVGWKIKTVVFGVKGGKLTGIRTNWTNSKSSQVGTVPTTTSGDEKFWTCDPEGNLLMRGKITKVKVNNDIRIGTVQFIRSTNTAGSMPPWLLDLTTLRYIGSADQPEPEAPQVVESAPEFDGAVWSIRGFYGSVSKDEIVDLGFIWGRDD